MKSSDDIAHDRAHHEARLMASATPFLLCWQDVQHRAKKRDKHLKPSKFEPGCRYHSWEREL